MKLKMMLAWLFISLTSSFYAYSNDMLVGLAKDYLRQNRLLLSCFELQANIKIDVDSLAFTEQFNLDHGERSLRRETTFEDALGASIVLYTHGSFQCFGERILGIKEVR